jgi:hypothetical protein
VPAARLLSDRQLRHELQAQSVFDKARSVISESRYELAGMRGTKGTVANRKATSLGVPTGKLAGLVQDVRHKINGLGT